MFVTSSLSSISASTTVPPQFPAFGGVGAADWVVTFDAFNAGLVPGWDGMTPLWHALLSTSTLGAYLHVPVAGPVYNLKGQLMAKNFTQFWSGTLLAPIVDEKGDPVSTTSVWTGTMDGGTVAPFETADDWTSNFDMPVAAGDASQLGGGSWLNGSQPFSASGRARLYGVSPVFTVPNLVPEPSSFMLLAVGAVCVFCRWGCSISPFRAKTLAC
jgi:hypothetical protein